MNKFSGVLIELEGHIQTIWKTVTRGCINSVNPMVLVYPNIDEEIFPVTTKHFEAWVSEQ